MPRLKQKSVACAKIGLGVLSCLVLIQLSAVASAQTKLGIPTLNEAPANTSDLAPEPTWQPATQVEIISAFSDWLSESGADESTTQRVQDFVAEDFETNPKLEIVDRVIDAIVIARPEVNHFRETLRKQRSGARAPDFSNLLDNPHEKDLFRHHVRLYYARWLAQNEFYDEALQHFGKIEIKKVLDPATLLFHRGLMEHQLLKKKACVKTINQLLENIDLLPRRYQVLSKLVLADIKPLETDSLDEISRLMSDIQRRTGLHRSGKLVLNKEAEVIKKLDKLIEGLEAQQQSKQMASNLSPSTPMDESQRATGQGNR